MIDALIKTNLDIYRLDASTRAKVIKLLDQMEHELEAKLMDKHLTTWNKSRIEKLLGQAYAITNEYYGEARDTLAEVLDGVASVSATSTAAAITAAINVSLDVGMPTTAYVAKLASEVITQGATQKEWWAAQNKDTNFKFSQQVRQGLIQGETNAQIIKRVQSVMDVSRRNAAALVQTSVQTVANEARMAVFEENRNIAKGYIYHSTLDGHTCPTCGAMDGKTWTIDKKPIDGAPAFRNPPLHFSCRCIMSVVVKTNAELGFPEIPDARPGQRASSDGPISAKTTFEDFLGRQSQTFQDETLGKGRAQLWRDGKITLEDLINGNGRPLTLEQLKARHS
jgi:SPP1 gp7 family putative phage head morphogenesis protein